MSFCTHAEVRMFAVRLQLADEIREYSISHATPSGWEVRLEENQRVRRLDRYQDWHRVERARASIEREVATLTASGWHLASPPTRH